MTIYYEKLQDGTIGKYTNSLKIAKLNDFEFSTNENIVGYKGKSYLESEFEQIKQTEAYKTEQLQKAQEAKIQEATDKAYAFEEKDALVTVNATNLKTRASGIYHIEGNLTNNIKMSNCCPLEYKGKRQHTAEQDSLSDFDLSNEPDECKALDSRLSDIPCTD